MSSKTESVSNLDSNTDATEDASTTRRVAEAAHNVISDTAAKAESVEKQVRERAAKAGEKVEVSQAELTQQLESSIAKAEAFAREKPVAAAGIAFAAGMFATMLLRK